MKFQYQGIFLFFFLITINIYGQERSFDKLWLSGEPSTVFNKAVKKSGMQKYFAIPGKRGSENLILWIREGKDLQYNSYRSDTLTSNEELKSFSPEGQKNFHKYSKVRGLDYAITYPFKTEGYHNFFLISKNVLKDTLFIHVAKAERLSHKCRSGHKREVNRVKPMMIEEIPFQLIRGRIDFENFHLMLQSGQDLELTALKYGETVSDVKIEVISQNGWKKRMVTDENGSFSFQIISDHFSALQDLEKKHISRLLIRANCDEIRSGKYDNEVYNHIRYSSSLELDYIPSIHLYQSKTWSVFIALLSLVVLSLIAYFILRKRRNDRYKLLNDD